VTGDLTHQYGLIVDRFIGQRELVVQPLDPVLGKIRNIAAGALMDDGSPVADRRYRRLDPIGGQDLYGQPAAHGA